MRDDVGPPQFETPRAATLPDRRLPRRSLVKPVFFIILAVRPSFLHSAALPTSIDSACRTSRRLFTLAYRALRLTGLAVGLGVSALTAYRRGRAAQMASRNDAGRSRHSSPYDEDTDSYELVYCHACSHEWEREGHGLTCPRCYGEVTEIVSLCPAKPRDLLTAL